MLIIYGDAEMVVSSLIHRAEARYLCNNLPAAYI